MIWSSVLVCPCFFLFADCFDLFFSVGPMVGLFLISIGTGGIKPCVVTFGGDQFPAKQVHLTFIA